MLIQQTTRIKSLLFIFVIVATRTFGQVCGFHHQPNPAFEKRVAQYINNGAKKTNSSDTSVITIPVVVHVLHNNSQGTIGGVGNSNITDQQILSQIDVLNDAFGKTNSDTIKTQDVYKDRIADFGIQFCLATRDPDGNRTNGITRQYTNQVPFGTSSFLEIADIISWPSDEYLNIWVTVLNINTLGFAQFPDSSSQPGLATTYGTAASDGLVISYKYFGNNIGTSTNHDYNLGKTAVHEIGHWLGLLHPFGNGSCSGSDFVDDTPQTDGNLPKCFERTSCDGEPDMYENYMEYARDSCLVMFTEGQKTRAHAIMNLSPRRIAIQESKACCGAFNSTTLPFYEDFLSKDLTDNGWEFQTYGSNATIDFYDDGNQVALELEADSSESIHITTPILDFSKSYTPQFRFKYAQNYSSLSYNDSLVIEYELTCSGDWINFTTLNGTSLHTVTSTSGSFPSEDQWNELVYDLSQFENEGFVKFRFNYYSNGVNNIFLDNIHFYKEKETFDYILYPNPASDQLTIEAIFEGEKTISYKVYDLVGKLKYIQPDFYTRSNKFQVDVSDLASGIYILDLIVDGEHKSAKFVVTLD